MRKPAFIRSAAAATLFAAAFAAGGIKADAAPSILFDVKTGAVLEHREAFQRWHPASLTKLMTAYVAFRAVAAGEVELTSPIKMTKHAAKEPPSKMGYKPGQVLTLDNALKILMVKSANDVATAVGENIGGSEKQFAERMNAEAARLGMSSSRFVNAHGLHSPDQYTTARDLAVLVRAIRTEFPQYESYFDIEALLSGKDVIKTNVVLLGRFDGADGMKTGFICASGFNLASTATRNGRTVAAVVLGAESSEARAEQAAAMLARGFAATSSATDTLATLEPYGADRDKAADLKKTVCSKEAASERWATRDENGKPVYHSPYLHEPAGEPQTVVVGLGGATGKVPPAMQAGTAAALGVKEIPIPSWRPDLPPPGADAAKTAAQAAAPSVTN